MSSKTKTKKKMRLNPEMMRMGNTSHHHRRPTIMQLMKTSRVNRLLFRSSTIQKSKLMLLRTQMKNKRKRWMLMSNQSKKTARMKMSLI